MRKKRKFHGNRYTLAKKPKLVAPVPGPCRSHEKLRDVTYPEYDASGTSPQLEGFRVISVDVLSEFLHENVRCPCGAHVRLSEDASGCRG